jgi:hypothetical protein
MEKFGMDNGDQKIDRHEFFLLCVVRLGAISPSTIQSIYDRFDALDVNKDGTLDFEEITEIQNNEIKQRRQSLVGKPRENEGDEDLEALNGHRRSVGQKHRASGKNGHDDDDDTDHDGKNKHDNPLRKQEDKKSPPGHGKRASNSSAHTSPSKANPKAKKTPSLLHEEDVRFSQL